MYFGQITPRLARRPHCRATGRCEKWRRRLNSLRESGALRGNRLAPFFLGGNCAARAVIQICTGSRATYGLNRSVARQNASEDYHVCSVYGCHVSLMLDVFLTGMLRVDHSLHVSFFRTKSTLRLVLCLLNSSWLLESTNGVLTKTLNSLVGNASTETATE